MRRLMMVGALILVAVGALSFGTRSASAHEHRTVDNGKYQFIVGFLVEPAVSDELNSIDFRVSDLSQPVASPDSGDDDAPEGSPVTGLESTLQVDIIFGDQTRTLELEPRWNTPGAYNAYVIPVAPGDYSFHIYGTINGDAIDETFTPGPDTFSSVADRAELEFPAAESSPAATAPIAFGSVDSGSTGGTPTGTLLGGFAAIAMLGAASFAVIRRRRVSVPVPVLAGSAGD